MEFAAPSETENDSKHYRAHVYLYELFPGDEQGSSETKLEPLGHWSVDGSVESVGLHREADGESTLSPWIMRILNFGRDSRRDLVLLD